MNATDWYVVMGTVIICIFNLVYMQQDRMVSAVGMGEKIKSILPETNKKRVYFVIMVCACLFLAISTCFFYQDLAALYVMKRLYLVTLLFPMAAIDFRKKIIPNKLLIAALSCRAIILLLEIILHRDNLIYTLISEITSAFGLLAICMIVTFITKDGIGMGDVKLFFVMALFQGFVGVSSAIMISLIIAFIASAYLLIFKKKARKHLMPLGPSILVGTYISVFLTGT